MIDWYRKRARQERRMARQAHGRNARWAHQAMLRLLVSQCAAQPELDRSICPGCALRSLCRKAQAQSFLARLAA